MCHVTFVSFVESKECLTCHIQLFISHNILSWMTLATFIKLSSLLQHKACIYLLLLWLFSFLQMQLGLICCLQFVFVSFFKGWNSQKELSSMLMFVPCSVTEPTTGLWLLYCDVGVAAAVTAHIIIIIIMIIILIVFIIIFIIIIIIILGP